MNTFFERLMMEAAIVFLILTLLCIPAEAKHRAIRVLAIGNSFSEDAIEQNLHMIAAEKSVPMVIANMYIGGCTIDRHWNNVQNDVADYRYTRFEIDGSRSVRNDVALSEVIGAEQWDYISVQQASGVSGIESSYANLPALVEWIRSKAPQAEVVFHQTWAYAVGAPHKEFPNYDCDQRKMYEAICVCVKKACERCGIKTVIPSGQALQYLREGTGNADYTRDGYHLSKGVGRYLAACTWFQTLTGIDARTIKYRPDGSDPRTDPVSKKEAAKVRQCVSKICRNL